MLYFLLFSIAASKSIALSDPECGESISNCESCFSNAAGKCGWCGDNKQCLAGSSDGPKNGTCTDWKFTFDMECHLNSVSPLPDGARIGIVVFSSLVAIGTAVFWICIFPMCSTTKIEEDSHADYQIQ